MRLFSSCLLASLRTTAGLEVGVVSLPSTQEAFDPMSRAISGMGYELIVAMWSRPMIAAKRGAAPRSITKCLRSTPPLATTAYRLLRLTGADRARRSASFQQMPDAAISACSIAFGILDVMIGPDVLQTASELPNHNTPAVQPRIVVKYEKGKENYSCRRAGCSNSTDVYVSALPYFMTLRG